MRVSACLAVLGLVVLLHTYATGEPNAPRLGPHPTAPVLGRPLMGPPIARSAGGVSPVAPSTSRSDAYIPPKNTAAKTRGKPRAEGREKHRVDHPEEYFHQEDKPDEVVEVVVDADETVPADINKPLYDDTFDVSVMYPAFVKRTHSDEYHCASFPAPKDPSHAVAFAPIEQQPFMHHLLLFACERPTRPAGEWWDCLAEPQCDGDPILLYAWALQAPALTLPKGIGFVTGGASAATHFVVQIHFKDPHPGLPVPVGVKITLRPGFPQLFAGIIQNVGAGFTIPPKTRETHVNLECTYKGQETLNVFAYRAHAHYLGREIIGVRTRKGAKTTIAKRSAQLPQTFFIMPDTMTVKRGDKVWTDCAFDSSERNVVTRVGSRSKDEMCNLYLMFYTTTPSQTTKLCIGNNGKGGSMHGTTAKPGTFALMPSKKYNQISAIESKPPSPATLLVIAPPALRAKTQQLVNVAARADGSVLFLHRGPTVVWDQSTFTMSHKLKTTTPIPVPVVVGPGGEAWAAGLTCMPEGLYIDPGGNVWVTDTGAHQVLKFSSDGSEVLLRLGTRFAPGAGQDHFCKPTDVEVGDDGTIFVSDGYCNQRVVVFSASGQYQREIPLPPPKSNQPVLVHSLTQDRAAGVLLVADRENGRVFSVPTEAGAGKPEVVFEPFRQKVFALAYSPAALQGVLGVVLHRGEDSQIVVLSRATKRSKWTPLVYSEVMKGTFLHSLAVVATPQDDATVTLTLHSTGWRYMPDVIEPVRKSFNITLPAYIPSMSD